MESNEFLISTNIPMITRSRLQVSTFGIINIHRMSESIAAKHVRQTGLCTAGFG